jgi:hypothetical protein
VPSTEAGKLNELLRSGPKAVDDADQRQADAAIALIGDWIRRRLGG